MKMMDDNVLIRTEKTRDATSGGIFIPLMAQKEELVGHVVSIGPGKEDKFGKRSPIPVDIGDRVLYNAHTGTQLDINGETHIIIKECEISAVIGTEDIQNVPRSYCCD